MEIAKEQNLSKKLYTTKDYVQDSLMLLFDGIENSGYGIHTDGVVSPARWLNLIDNGESGWGIPNNLYYPKSLLFGKDYVEFYSGTHGFQWGNSKYLENDEYGKNTIATPRYIEICFDANGNKDKFYQAGLIKHHVAIVDIDKYPTGRHCVGFSTQSASGIVCFDGQQISDLSELGLARSNGGTNNSSWIMGNYNDPRHYKYCCMRFYGRDLNETEIKHNFIVDKERFGI